MVIDERLLGDAVLCHAQQVGALRNRHNVADRIQCVGIHVLELVGEHVAAFGELVNRILVVVVGDNLEVGNLRGGAIGCRVKRADAEAHVFRGKRHQAAELASADDAHGRPRQQTLDLAAGFVR